MWSREAHRKGLGLLSFSEKDCYENILTKNSEYYKLKVRKERGPEKLWEVMNMLKRMLSLLLVFSLLLAAVPAAAAVPSSPFGETAIPLERDEMEEVEGEFKHIAVGATAGALFSTASYLITTPRSSWTASGAARSALAGAVSGAGGAMLRP